jgi:ABC-type uncharacterized transport system substrate-binding protein
MKKTIYLCLMVFFVHFISLSISLSSHAANPVKVDVLFMNHGPLMDTLNKMKSVFSGYGNQLNVSWHDFNSEEGGQFMAKMGIKQHVPLIIWIDGTPKWTVGAKQITFTGFPTGSGPAFFQGKWIMDDLKAALNLATGNK